MGGVYTPFGEKYAPDSAGVNGFFAGMLGIADEGSITDAYQSTTRLYHSLESRWVSPDRAGLSSVDLSDPNTLNRYAYAENNPLINTDPSGLQSSSSQSNCPYPCFTTNVYQPATIAAAIISYPAWIILCGGWFGNNTDWAGVSPVPCGRTFMTSYLLSSQAA